MNCTKAIIAGALALVLCCPAMADLLEDANAASVRGDYSIAMKIWIRLANQGLPAAQLALGRAYFEGPEAMWDPTEAENWLRKAATQGNVDGQLMLAIFLEQKTGGRYPFDPNDADRVEAASWFLKAARQNNRTAQVAIAKNYENGWGVSRDFVQAAYWFHKVVKDWTGQAETKRGDRTTDTTRRLSIAESEHELEHLYRAGLGVTQSEPVADMWARKSIADGYVAPPPWPPQPMPIPPPSPTTLTR